MIHLLQGFYIELPSVFCVDYTEQLSSILLDPWQMLEMTDYIENLDLDNIRY